ncbi:MAG: SH3 domain-containing protein [Candidatus Electrothrix sp. AUS1_2]|nr:SH3 domain-containing protein [Candidatus Electrothrix sp. AUS1_2]
MKKLIILLIWLVLFVIASPRIYSQDLYRLPPVNESIKDDELFLFIKQLRSAVQERNANKLQRMMSDDIKLTFGPTFKKTPEEILELKNPKSHIWNELDAVLRLGGAFIGKSYCIPYTYASFPPELDPYAYQVIIKPSVVARISPDRNAEKVALLDFAIVRTDSGASTMITGTKSDRWVKIYLNNNQEAYVLENTLRSPIDYRACFERREKGWVMTHLISGD